MIKNIDKFLSSRLIKNVSSIHFNLEDKNDAMTYFVKFVEKGYRCNIIEGAILHTKGNFIFIASRDDQFKPLIIKATKISDPQELDQFFMDEVAKVLKNERQLNLFIDKINKYFKYKWLLKL